ncbi:hypothetical protein B0T19DRAFT_397299 [Cercophora scortea]|uniref:Uncharacterized protein n=1 Tax=Cercophora scortea TaxID=314031 RepID=A0AAE0J7J9_9PEZI|nr:hypothetical protein B0T19DRAFT_397299 [Cercophora scortea]
MAATLLSISSCSSSDKLITNILIIVQPWLTSSSNSTLPAKLYNLLIIDHEATERAELLGLKHNHLPAPFKILALHGVADSVELHLLHRHFTLEEGEAIVHRTLEISGSEDAPSISVDVAKAVSCPESVQPFLVPLLWMASPNGSLVAYEYGLRQSANASQQSTTASISSERWNSFAQEFSACVHRAGIADLVSLKDKSCINGGEYVVPSMRVLFRIPTQAVNLQPGSEMLESGWDFDRVGDSDPTFPECTDGHVTKTERTSAGIVARDHVTEEDGINAFNGEEVSVLYTNVMWDAAKSEGLWALGQMVDAAT